MIAAPMPLLALVVVVAAAFTVGVLANALLGLAYRRRRNLRPGMVDLIGQYGRRR